MKIMVVQLILLSQNLRCAIGQMRLRPSVASTLDKVTTPEDRDFSRVVEFPFRVRPKPFGRGHNPSIALLPNLMRRELRAAGWETAEYLATFRHGLLDQCSWYLRNRSVWDDLGANCYTSIAILDAKLAIIADVINADETLWTLPLFDARLSTSRKSETVLAHGWNYGHMDFSEKDGCPWRITRKREWDRLRGSMKRKFPKTNGVYYVFQIYLFISEGPSLRASYKEFVPASRETPLHFNRDRNLGIIRSDQRIEQFSFLRWIADPLVVVQTHMLGLKSAKEATASRSLYLQLFGKYFRLSNNGNPFTLCSGILGTFVHASFPNKSLFRSNPPLFQPRIYFHSLILFTELAPHRILAMTPFFGLPSLNMESASYDLLHFIVSVVDDARDNGQMIVTYGAGDCVSGYFRIGREEIWDFAFRHKNMTTFRHRAPFQIERSLCHADI